MLLATAALLLLAGCVTPDRRPAAGRAFERAFAWTHRGRPYRLELKLRSDVYEEFRRRERTREYDLFASDLSGKPFVRTITRGLRDYARASGLTEEQVPYFVVAFVQNLPYTSDDVTTGFDEYPRFPYETLYDNGGDCEDTSILASALLHELGYGVALLRFPDHNHVAVGVQCQPAAGKSSYTHGGVHYCYLETTGENWEIGEVPPDLRGLTAVVTPVVERPVLRVDFDSRSEYLPATGTTVEVAASVTNLGSQTARRTVIQVALQTPATGTIADSERSRQFTLAPDQSYAYEVTGLRLATGKEFRIYVRAWADNAAPAEAVSDWIRWD